jgi:hypothetical protein
MAFADDFSQCMSQYGIAVDPSAVPEHDLLKSALDYAQNWLSSLDPGMRAGFDAATTNDPVSVVLADSSVNAAPAIPGLLQAFDQAQGQPISTLLQTAAYCCDNANQSPSSSSSSSA